MLARWVLFDLFNVGFVDAAGGIDTFGNLVFAVGNAFHSEGQFTEFGQVQFPNVSVDRHFAKVSAHILYTKLRHPRLYQTEFVFIYEEFYLYRSFAISVIWHLSVPLAFLLPRKPVLIKHVGEWLGHDRIAREALTFAAKVQFLFFHAITGKAISRSMLLLATEATAFYVCRASTAVKAAFAR